MFRAADQRRQSIIMLPMICLVALAAMLVMPAAHAQPTRYWQAMSIAVDFPNNQLRVLQTTYYGKNDPGASVIAGSTLDITTSCTTVGAFTYAGNAAVFSGANYIRCSVPSWRLQLAALSPSLPGANNDTLSCDTQAGPMFSMADVQLDPRNGQNPIIDARDIGVIFNLPTSVSTARTQLVLSSAAYTSSNWSLTSSGNRTLMGMNGDAIVASAGYFAWLGNMNVNWQTFFATVLGGQLGSWSEPPIQSWKTTTAPFTLRTGASTVYIGYSPTTGTYLRGTLRAAQIDPGCFAG